MWRVAFVITQFSLLGAWMSNVGLAAILVAFFLLAIGLIRVLDRLIDTGADPDEPPDTGAAEPAESENAP